MKIFAVLLCLTGALPACAQSDDFDDGNDTGWTRFAPLAPFGGSTFVFPSGGYRLACNPSPDPASFGPSRLSALRPAAVYSQFAVCVDFTGWNVAQDTSMGVLARLQPNQSAGNIAGYALTYQGNDHDLEINRVTAEAGTRINAAVTAITLDPAKTYRMVFFGIGSYLEGRIFDRDQPLVPLATVSATDPTYASGSNGLLVFSERNTAIEATFDNYRADAGAAPALYLNQVPAGGLTVSWDTERGLPWTLASSATLRNWAPQLPGQLENGATQLRLTAAELSLNPVQFFRLTKGPAAP